MDGAIVGETPGGRALASYDDFFDDAIARLQDERRYRVFADLERIAGRFPTLCGIPPHGPKEVVSSGAPTTISGWDSTRRSSSHGRQRATRLGTGAGGTRNIAGTNHPLVELEGELADLHGKEAALVFTSGYISNQAGISTIAKLVPDCLILSDALNHNSMIEGIRQSGRRNASSATTTSIISRELLKAAGPDRPKLIVFEICLFDGRRRRANQSHSAILPIVTAR